MPRIEPLAPDANDFVERLISKSSENMGFPANSFLTMAHYPEMAEAFLQLARVVNFGDTELPVEIKRLVSYVASKSSGCQYCVAHTGFQATRSGGISAEKMEAAWEYETSPLFTDAERAALRVAQSAGTTPNAVTDGDFKELKKHFTDRQIVELVGQISVFGFLNRWNDTMATQLESVPIEYAEDHLAQSGWEVSKHTRK